MCQAYRGKRGLEKLRGLVRSTQLVNGASIVTKTHNPRHAWDALSPSIFGKDNFSTTGTLSLHPEDSEHQLQKPRGTYFPL